jgi:hypothetical protein
VSVDHLPVGANEEAPAIRLWALPGRIERAHDLDGRVGRRMAREAQEG